MRKLKFALSRFAFALVSLGAAVSATAEPTVVGYELVSSVRSSRTTFDYTYRVRLSNAGDPYSSVILRATSSVAATTVLDGEIYVSFIASGASILTHDTFTIRQDRLVRFNPGAITLQVEGEKVASTNEPIEILSARFVEMGGIPEHAGFLPIARKPVANPNEPAILQLDLTGVITNGRVELLGANGAVLAASDLSPLGETVSILVDYVARVQVPSEPFSIRVTGTDSQGVAFDQIWPETFEPADVNLQITGLNRSATAGSSLVLPIRVSNFGAGQSFRVLVESLSPKVLVAQGGTELQLASGNSQTIDVMIAVAADAPTFSEHGVKVTVSGVSDPSAVNQLETAIEVAPDETPN